MNSYKVLLTIFLVTMIPNIAVYAIHAHHEFEEAFEHMPIAATNEQGNEQFLEGIFFSAITIGYVVTTIYIVAKPNNTTSYYVILVGTVIIIVIYYITKTVGMPVPDGHDNWIVDYTLNWKDNVTKIAQTIFIIPLAMLLDRIYVYRDVIKNWQKIVMKFEQQSKKKD